MKIKQLANCSIAIRSKDPTDLDDDGLPRNYEFLQNTIYDLDEVTANFLLNMKVYSNGTITDPQGEFIPEGTLCSDFIEVE